MRLHNLISELNKKYEDNVSDNEIKSWFEQLIKSDQKNLDAHFLYCSVLYNMGLDKLCDKAEISFIVACNEVIKSFKQKTYNKHHLVLAKAYTYLAMVKFYAVDTLRHIEEAKKILYHIPDSDKDKELLVKYCQDKIQNPNRKVLFYIDENGKFIL